MDIDRLLLAVHLAEQVGCESGDFAGLNLGRVMQSWPSEVTSGRVSSGRHRSAGHRVAKTYVKFVQAFTDLEQAVTQLSGEESGTTGRVSSRTTGRKSSAATGPSALSPQRFRDMPVTSTALVPFSGAPTSSGLPDVPPFRALQLHTPGQQPGVTGSPTLSQFNCSARPRQGLPQPQQQHVQQHSQPQLLHVPSVGGVPVPFYEHVQNRFYDPTAHSPRSWRRVAAWCFSLLVTVVAPRLVFRIISLLLERSLVGSYFLGWRVATAAQAEAESTGDRFVGFLEHVMGVCTEDPQQSPASSLDQARVAAHTAAALAQTVSRASDDHNVSAMDLALIAERAARAVVQASPAPVPPSTATGSWADMFQVPTWFYVLTGFVAAGYRRI